MPQILEALALAVERGLRLPLVYNTSAYDSLESIRLMDGLVDIYMPDFKLWDAEHCAKYLVARDYADACPRRDPGGMHAQVGELKVDEQNWRCAVCWCGIWSCPDCSMTRAKSCAGLRRACRRDTCVNVMDQFYPAYKAETEPRFAQINRLSS